MREADNKMAVSNIIPLTDDAWSVRTSERCDLLDSGLDDAILFSTIIQNRPLFSALTREYGHLVGLWEDLCTQYTPVPNVSHNAPVYRSV